MKWINNLKQLTNEGTVGKCPFCGSLNTDYMFYIHKNGRFHLHMWCDSCGELTHVDGKGIPVNRKCVDFDDNVVAKRQVTA